MTGICLGGCSTDPKELYARGHCRTCYHREQRRGKWKNKEEIGPPLPKQMELSFTAAPDPPPEKKEEKPVKPKSVQQPKTEPKPKPEEPKDEGVTVKSLCIEAAQAIVQRIKKLCNEDGEASEIKVLTEALSKMDDILFGRDQ